MNLEEILEHDHYVRFTNKYFTEIYGDHFIKYAETKMYS